MADPGDINGFKSADAKLRDSLPLPQDASEMFPSRSRYLKFINIARITLALTAVICGLALVIVAHKADFLRDVGKDPQTWIGLGYLFGIGFLASWFAAIALVIEYLARPAATKRFSIISFALRFIIISTAAVAIFYAMHKNYGDFQAIGAVVSLFLVLAAVREHDSRRIKLGFLATLAIGLTVWGTQTPYQYAQHHAEEIVAAGREIKDRIVIHPKGREISIDDPSIPRVLRKLGAQRIWIDDDRVAVYVGGETEFQICLSDSPGCPNPVWGFRGKGATQISDRLWTNDY
jgi:hypothetical protein